MSRPSSYTKEAGDTICERLASGESLRAICREDGQPSQTTVFRWLEVNAPFREQYTRARELQADVLAEETLDIADEDPATVIQTEGEAEVRRVDSAAVAHQRLRIDARKWYASKVAPKKYGDKVGVEHSADASMADLVMRSMGG